MAFIDKIGEKISSGANAVSVSTKRVTESARINNEISANTAEIDKRMKQLGICVKSRLMEQIHDAEAERLAEEIDKFIARNEELAAELRRVKGIRRCEKCGIELPANSVFCPSCGARNEPAAQNAASQSQPTSAQQGRVAVKVKAPETAEYNSQADISEPVINQKSEPSAQKGTYCTVCGYHETDGAVFCSNCGRKLIK